MMRLLQTIASIATLTFPTSPVKVTKHQVIEYDHYVFCRRDQIGLVVFLCHPFIISKVESIREVYFTYSSNATNPFSLNLNYAKYVVKESGRT